MINYAKEMLDVVMLKQFKQSCKDMIFKLKQAGYDKEEAKLYYFGDLMRGGWIYHMGLANHWFEKWWKRL